MSRQKAPALSFTVVELLIFQNRSEIRHKFPLAPDAAGGFDAESFIEDITSTDVTLIDDIPKVVEVL